MKVLIKQATIIDPESSHNQQLQDILIVNGIITSIQPFISETADTTIEFPGLFISPGWTDIFADFCDPGYEFKETLETGATAAAAGGFTTVMIVPNTKPVADNKAQVEYITHKSRLLPVNVIPLGAITKNTAGKELAEMYDMHNSGAVSFTDGRNAVQSAGVLVKALQYVKAFGGIIIQVPDDNSVVPHGLMNEGVVSTRLGLAGKPALSEELIVARDLKLASYADSKIHFTGVSSPQSLRYIQEAKATGIRVTCSVTPYHLFFCDEDLMGYDTNLKVNPPLRSRADMMELRKAVERGLVDCIATHHSPQEKDSKIVEFENAKNGMTGLETCYPALKTALPEISEEQWVELLSLNASKIFGLERPKITIDSAAVLTLYQPAASFTYLANRIRSKSGNSPFLGKALNGNVVGIINRQHLYLNQ